MDEPEFEQMMERMLGAPIPVALGVHPMDLIPYAYVVEGSGTWHLDPVCSLITGHAIKLIDIVPPPNAVGDYWPYVDAYAIFRGDLFLGEGLSVSRFDESGPEPICYFRVKLQPCGLCVVAARGLPRRRRAEPEGPGPV